MSSEMKVKDEKIKKSENAPEETAETSEFTEPRWSVVTYETVAASGLTYNEALEWVKKLDSEKISGLCIVTDQAAERINK